MEEQSSWDAIITIQARWGRLGPEQCSDCGDGGKAMDSRCALMVEAQDLLIRIRDKESSQRGPQGS